MSDTNTLYHFDTTCVPIDQVNAVSTIDQLLDITLLQFASDRSLIFNQKKDLIFIDCKWLSRLSSIDHLKFFISATKEQPVIILMTQDMYLEHLMPHRTLDKHASKLAMILGD